MIISERFYVMGCFRNKDWSDTDWEGLFAAVLGLSLIVGGLFVVSWVAGMAQKEAAENRKKFQEVTVSESPFGRTIKHDGHLWVIWKGSDHVTHHPDCSCGKGQAEEDYHP